MISFLKKFKTTKNGIYTHKTLKGMYYLIPENELYTFYELYSNHIISNDMKLVEINKYNGIIVLNLILQYIHDDFLLSLISLINSFFSKFSSTYYIYILKKNNDNNTDLLFYITIKTDDEIKFELKQYISNNFNTIVLKHNYPSSFNLKIDFLNEAPLYMSTDKNNNIYLVHKKFDSKNQELVPEKNIPDIMKNISLHDNPLECDLV